MLLALLDQHMPSHVTGLHQSHEIDQHWRQVVRTQAKLQSVRN